MANGDRGFVGKGQGKAVKPLQPVIIDIVIFWIRDRIYELCFPATSGLPFDVLFTYFLHTFFKSFLFPNSQAFFL
jgi:hypothetical protein